MRINDVFVIMRTNNNIFMEKNIVPHSARFSVVSTDLTRMEGYQEGDGHTLLSPIINYDASDENLALSYEVKQHNLNALCFFLKTFYCISCPAFNTDCTGMKIELGPGAVYNGKTPVEDLSCKPATIANSIKGNTRFFSISFPQSS